MDVLSEAKIGTMNLLCIYFFRLLLLLLQLISINMFSVGRLQNLYCTCIMQCLCMCISILFGKVHVNINLLFVEFEVMHKYNLWKIVFETRFKSKLGFAECSLFPLFVNCCCYFNEYKSYLLKIVNIGNANSGTSSNWLGWRIIAIKNIEIPGHLHSPKRNEDSSFPASVIVNACQDYEGKNVYLNKSGCSFEHKSSKQSVALIVGHLMHIKSGNIHLKCYKNVGELTKCYKDDVLNQKKKS